MAIDLNKRSAAVKSFAAETGFSYCGISAVCTLDDEARALEQWLQQGRHGVMHYMENHFDKRIDPAKLVEGARSVITLMYNYYPERHIPEDGKYKISKYAYGMDYHYVIKEKLHIMVQSMQQQFGNFHARIFTDSAPVMEKAWAVRSGIGWQGKNTNIINRYSGSFFFLAVIICDLDLAADGPIKDYCGTCTACLDACPTQALTPYTLDATKCISYLTIELRNAEIPDTFAGKMDGWIFGCDICQDVCPWNRFSKPHRETRFEPDQPLMTMTDDLWEALNEELFRALFNRSAIQRTGFKGLKRNIAFISRSS